MVKLKQQKTPVISEASKSPGSLASKNSKQSKSPKMSKTNKVTNGNTNDAGDNKNNSDKNEKDTDKIKNGNGTEKENDEELSIDISNADGTVRDSELPKDEMKSSPIKKNISSFFSQYYFVIVNYLLTLIVMCRLNLKKRGPTSLEVSVLLPWPLLYIISTSFNKLS